jgi:hypothetical protein
MSDKRITVLYLIILLVSAVFDSCYAKGMWYYGDTHTHTVHSDGRGTVGQMVQAAKEKGMNFIIITDHNTIKQKDDCELENTDTFMCIYGDEVTRGDGLGHGNAYFIDKAIPWFWGGNQDNIDRTLLQGGLFYINHPFLKGHPWGDWDVNGFTGIEVWNGGTNYDANQQALAKWEEYLNKGLKIFGIAGSDAHSTVNVGEPRICAYLEEFTPGALFNAMSKGHFYGTSGPDMRFEINGEMMGSTVFVLSGEAINISIKTWVDWLYAFKVDDAVNIYLDSLEVILIRNGEKIKVWSVTSEIAELEYIDTAIESSWYRIELRSNELNTIFAFSNPIWISIK